MQYYQSLIRLTTSATQLFTSGLYGPSDEMTSIPVTLAGGGSVVHAVEAERRVRTAVSR